MKLYYAPGACSIGIHLLLEEIGRSYTAVPVDIKAGEQFKPDYIGINPKSKVPALLRDDGSVLTEFPAICIWLARTNPEMRLIPDGLEGEVRTLEILDFAVSTVHMQGFSRIFRPGKFAPSEADHQLVKGAGLEIAAKGFAHLGRMLGEKPFITGDRLTVADCALFYTLFWAIDRIRMTLPDNCEAYYRRLKERASAKKVFADEQISLA